jgi:hypothetical protein
MPEVPIVLSTAPRLSSSRKSSGLATDACSSGGKRLNRLYIPTALLAIEPGARGLAEPPSQDSQVAGISGGCQARCRPPVA